MSEREPVHTYGIIDYTPFLAQGYTGAINLSATPEPVLTHEQWAIPDFAWPDRGDDADV